MGVTFTRLNYTVTNSVNQTIIVWVLGRLIRKESKYNLLNQLKSDFK